MVKFRRDKMQRYLRMGQQKIKANRTKDELRRKKEGKWKMFCYLSTDFATVALRTQIFLRKKKFDDPVICLVRNYGPENTTIARCLMRCLMFAATERKPSQSC